MSSRLALIILLIRGRGANSWSFDPNSCRNGVRGVRISSNPFLIRRRCSATVSKQYLGISFSFFTRQCCCLCFLQDLLRTLIRVGIVDSSCLLLTTRCIIALILVLLSSLLLLLTLVTFKGVWLLRLGTCLIWLCRAFSQIRFGGSR